MEEADLKIDLWANASSDARDVLMGRETCRCPELVPAALAFHKNAWEVAALVDFPVFIFMRE